VSGPWLPALALLAGLLSVTSPCVLPLLPGYITYISAPSASLRRDECRFRRLGAAIMFCVGFASVFVALGATASVVGQALLVHRDVLIRVSGVFMVALGLSFLGAFRLPAAVLAERRAPMHLVRTGPAGASLLGAAFAFGWTPCIGPVLASVLTMAATTSSVLGGSALLALYSAGFAVPFIGIAVWLDHSERLLRLLSNRGRVVERMSGVLLVVIGVAYVSGWWQVIFRPLQRWMSTTGWPPF
jgi:cytochrome c-type biogenesis protein